MAYNLDIEYALGEFVYLVTDPDQFKRLVTGYYVSMDGTVMYEVALASMGSKYYADELSRDKDVMITTQ